MNVETKAKVRKQMEFYFSEGNLPKDQYLQEQIAKSPDGFVPLEVFLIFNKLRPLVQSSVLLGRCLKKSKLLELNADKSGVRRRFELKQLEPENDRSIYLEGLSPHIKAEEVEQWFEAAAGRVLFVSLPRYRSSGDGKRFGFVEFEQSCEARSAVLLLRENGRPSGIFPKPASNKQLGRLLRLAKERGLDVTALEQEAGVERQNVPLSGPGIVEEGPLAGVRASSKRHWLRLRKAHFGSTRRLQQLLERRLRDPQQGEEVTESFELAPGSVLALAPPEDRSLTKREVKESLQEVIESVSYIDVTNPLLFYVRCDDAQGAQRVLAAISEQATCLGSARFLSETEQHLYSQRIAEDRQRKQQRRLTKRLKRQEQAEIATEEPKAESKTKLKAESKTKLKAESKTKLKEESKTKLKEESKTKLKEESKAKLKVLSGAESKVAPVLERTLEIESKLSEDNEENADDSELTKDLLGSVLVLREACLPLTKRVLKAHLSDVSTSLAYIDVIDGDSTAFVRCSSRAVVPEVMKVLLASRLGQVTVLEGLEEKRYLERVLSCRGAKKRKNAKRRLLREQLERQDDPVVKRQRR